MDVPYRASSSASVETPFQVSTSARRAQAMGLRSDFRPGRGTVRRFILTLFGPSDVPSPDATRSPVPAPTPSLICVASKSSRLPGQASVVPLQTVVAHLAQVCARRAAAPFSAGNGSWTGPGGVCVVRSSASRAEPSRPLLILDLSFLFSRYSSALPSHRHGLFVGHHPPLSQPPPPSLLLPAVPLPRRQRQLVSDTSTKPPSGRGALGRVGE
ncbi:hypothetical protein B0H17DRAFT_359173 [Mycena rosella]|uniref:Uncharacterized protein n=1 Tax=Mycena rosella TaxID=1033263 RepID=A0AAD7G3V0_MYCRO|nr:hypothetical protein B0H17DRAFT_359173 [Mycena rosella]